jgi:hypothetical protein
MSNRAVLCCILRAVVRRRALAFPAIVRRLPGSNPLFIASAFFVVAMADVSSASAGDPDKIHFDPSLVPQWKESVVEPPPYPDDRNLIALPALPGDSLKVFVDRASLSRADDYVLRFTLVIESGSGARNVLFEGIRCETGEYKTYGYGAAGGKLEPLKTATWRPIENLGQNAYRWRLYRHYVCTDSLSARGPEEFLRELQH